MISERWDVVAVFIMLWVIMSVGAHVVVLFQHANQNINALKQQGNINHANLKCVEVWKQTLLVRQWFYSTLVMVYYMNVHLPVNHFNAALRQSHTGDFTIAMILIGMVMFFQGTTVKPVYRNVKELNNLQIRHLGRTVFFSVALLAYPVMFILYWLRSAS